MAQGVLPSETIRRLLLQLPKRKRLFDAIEASPGLHARKLSRQLDMALGVVEHHLRALEKHGVIFGFVGGRRRTYYVSGQVKPEEARLIHALRKEPWGALLQSLAATEVASVADLAAEHAMAPRTVGYHLRKLQQEELVDNLRIGRNSWYTLRHARAVAAAVRRAQPAPRVLVASGPFGGVVERAQHHGGKLRLNDKSTNIASLVGKV